MHLFCDELSGIELIPSGDFNTCVNDLWHSFSSAFVFIANRHAPVIQKRVRGIDNCPWLNRDIKYDIRQRDYLVKKARKTNLSEDWKRYRCLRNRVTNKIKAAKARYNRQIIEENSGDSKAFWKTVKKIIPGETKEMPPRMKIGENISSDTRVIANALNSFFAGTAHRLLHSLGEVAYNIAKYNGDPTQILQRPPLKFQEVSKNFVLCQLQRLKTSKAVGLDDISPRLLKDAARIVAKPLADIINASLHQAKVPVDWKAARVIPLFKKGDVNNMDNYRPISILSIASKLLERAVHIQLVNYLREHKLLNPYQCGFRKGHSTEFAALSFADTIRRNIDLGLMTGAVFLDLRKAFDTVDHSTLLGKLFTIGVTGQEQNWFNDYLSGRSQVVGFNGVVSGSEPVTIGVPQGSILGPLLFILYVNDLPDVICNCSILMYADDTVLFCSGSDVTKIEKRLNDELNLIGRWLCDNNLFLNVAKTESMLFGTVARLKNVDRFQIQVHGHTIRRVFEFRYLGIVFDEHVNWNAHVKYVLGKAGKRIGMLGRIRKNLTVHCANTIYVSFIRPVLDYCDSVYNCCGEMNTNSLEKLQRRAARIVCKSQDSDCAMDFLKWGTLLNRREHHTFSIVNKCISGNCPQFFNSYFNFNKSISQRVTRQSEHLHLPRVRTEVAKRSFYYNGCIIYNKLKLS